MRKSTERLIPRFRSWRVRCLGCKRPRRGRPALNLPGQRPQGGRPQAHPQLVTPSCPGVFRGLPGSADLLCGKRGHRLGVQPALPAPLAWSPRHRAPCPGQPPASPKAQKAIQTQKLPLQVSLPTSRNTPPLIHGHPKPHTRASPSPFPIVEMALPSKPRRLRGKGTLLVITPAWGKPGY